jgi:hypothetical protein
MEMMEIKMSHNLQLAIQAEMVKPFQYGTNDCALFVANIYQRVFGVDLADGIRGTYNDEYHANRTLVKLGRWDGILLPKGFTKVEKHLIKRGDIVIAEGAAGIYSGFGKCIFAGGVSRPLENIETIYRKG